MIYGGPLHALVKSLSYLQWVTVKKSSGVIPWNNLKDTGIQGNLYDDMDTDQTTGLVKERE